MKLVPHTDIYVPDAETHFFGKNKAGRPMVLDYQLDRLTTAYRYMNKFRVAIDVGAHVGLLTRHMAEKFDVVHSFEVHPENFECLKANTKHLKNVVLHHAAVGAAAGLAGIDYAPKRNSGDRPLVPGREDMRMVALDDIGFELCDLIKMDVQGYESFVLEGAVRLLRYFRPVCIIEQEPKMAEVFGRSEKDAGRLMKRAGAKVQAHISADQIWTFDAADNVDFDKYRLKGDYHWDTYENGTKLLEMVDGTVAQVKLDIALGAVLDIGCGDGLFTAKTGAYGIDNCPRAIKLAQEHGVEGEVMSVFDVEKLGRRFVSVCLFDTFEHLFDQDRALEVIGRVTDKIHFLNPEPCQSTYHSREFTTVGLEKWMLRRGWRLDFRRRFDVTPRNTKYLMTFVKDGEPLPLTDGLMPVEHYNVPYKTRDPEPGEPEVVA